MGSVYSQDMVSQSNCSDVSDFSNVKSIQKFIDSLNKSLSSTLNNPSLESQNVNDNSKSSQKKGREETTNYLYEGSMKN